MPMILGLDIGTTKVAAVVVDRQGGLQACASQAHGADVACPEPRSEQDPARLLETARKVVVELPAELRSAVRAVGVTGQMHGIVLLDARLHPVTRLITWRDGRCLEGDFLAEVRRRTGYTLRTGFGLATLAWLVRHSQVPPPARRCATIHDLAVARLCGLQHSIIDPTDAAAWGLFSLDRLQWDGAAAESLGIDVGMLPHVLPCGAAAGAIGPGPAAEWGLPSGIPVAVGIGDNQASLLATLSDCDRQLALTIGTGAQVSAVMPAGFRPELLPGDCRYEYRPYTGGRVAVVAASLAGGEAWAWLARTVRSWQEALGQPAMGESQLYARLNELGAQAEDGPAFQPMFRGERYATHLRAIISNITLGNFDLGAVARALARGIVRNLKDMLPADAVRGRTEIVGSGNALRRNPLLAWMVREEFALPLQLREDQEEAAIGAARNAIACMEGGVGMPA